MECSCCGEDRDRQTMAALQCHEDVVVCRICIGWLAQKAGALDVTPTLPVSNMDTSVRFYEAAGFDVERYDDGFAFVRWDDESVFDLDLIEVLDPAHNGGGCYIITAEVDDWHQRLQTAGLPVTAPEQMPWGMYEFTLTDPDRNHIRVGVNAS